MAEKTNEIIEIINANQRRTSVKILYAFVLDFSFLISKYFNIGFSNMIVM